MKTIIPVSLLLLFLMACSSPQNPSGQNPLEESSCLQPNPLPKFSYRKVLASGAEDWDKLEMRSLEINHHPETPNVTFRVSGNCDLDLQGDWSVRGDSLFLHYRSHLADGEHSAMECLYELQYNLEADIAEDQPILIVNGRPQN